MLKISVIIPVYNCEKYLQQCLDSVILQTYENLEIICVNDGSKDKSLKILQKYAKNDSRIKIITQTNQGQSTARNAGLKQATGDYISFVDADDWISLSLYQKFVNRLKKINRDVDIFLFNACNYTDKPKSIYLSKFFEITEWKNFQYTNFLHRFDDCMNPFSGNMSAVNKIFRKSFLTDNNIEFCQGLIFEDQLFYLQSFIKAKSILISDDPMYMYRRQNSSSTMNSLGDKVFDIFKIINKMESFLLKTNNYEDYKYAFFQHKYIQYSFLFFETPYFKKERFYDEMKARLLMTKEEKLKKEVCKKLVGYDIYESILDLDWRGFYKKYKDMRV